MLFSKEKSGFTLVEIMIVVGVIAILATIAIPNFIRSKLIANEVNAIAAMRTLANAVNLYQNNEHEYPPVLKALATANPPYVDSLLATAIDQASAKTGYYYQYTSDNDAATFSILGTPQNSNTGKRNFYVDQNVVIRYKLDAPAGPNDPPVE